MPPTASTIPADKTGSTHWRSSSFVSRNAVEAVSTRIPTAVNASALGNSRNSRAPATPPSRAAAPSAPGPAAAMQPSAKGA